MSSAARILERLLRPFSRVQEGEGPLAILMLACVFLILSSYYVMKTVREGLILAGGTFGLRGDELKTYSTGAMAILLVFLVPAYSALANRVCRIRLINVSYILVVLSLGVFFVLGSAGVPVGVPFFVWLGLVSVFLVAQFWSFANDIYTEEQGKRLFAIIAIGGSVGAIIGPRLAKLADTFALMLVAAAMLVGSLVLFNVIEHLRARKHPGDQTAAAPITGAGAFQLVIRDRYLVLIAALLFITNLVNTTGEYVLSNAVADHAAQAIPAASPSDLATTTRELATTADRRELIKGFYADFFFYVNVIGFLLQAFVASRVIRYLGIRGGLLALPIVAFGAYAAIAAIGSLALVRVVKVAENAVDYSIQNTVRQTLFLPTTRAVKYKAKAAIDTFFHRAGDLLAAVFIGLGIHTLGWSGHELAIVNIVTVLVWFALAFAIARRHRLLTMRIP